MQGIDSKQSYLGHLNILWCNGYRKMGPAIVYRDDNGGKMIPDAHIGHPHGKRFGFGIGKTLNLEKFQEFQVCKF